MIGGVTGRRVLIVEDEYLLADDLREAIEGAGMEVVGPVPDAARALALVESEQRIDAALLDINLSGGSGFPIADMLVERAIPFAFATGYDEGELPPRFARFTRLEKPVRAGDVVGALHAMLGKPG